MLHGTRTIVQQCAKNRYHVKSPVLRVLKQLSLRQHTQSFLTIFKNSQYIITENDTLKTVLRTLLRLSIFCATLDLKKSFRLTTSLRVCCTRKLSLQRARQWTCYALQPALQYCETKIFQLLYDLLCSWSGSKLYMYNEHVTRAICFATITCIGCRLQFARTILWCNRAF